MAKQTFDGIPGLFLYPDHFPPAESAALVRDALALHARLEDAAARAGTAEKAHIPQPEFVRSAKHNLATEEFYTRVTLTEAGGRVLGCEYFPKYGEDGHALGYFRGTANLPDFVRDRLLAPIRGLMTDTGLADPAADLTWKLTMNFYRNVGGTVAGFPFHVDIPANGVVTMILNVQREAMFQIVPARPNVSQAMTFGLGENGPPTDIPLPVGGLLVLSGESRYEWKHRVLPSASTGPTPPGAVERVSLVLGFQ